jgi:hypothetical protein
MKNKKPSKINILLISIKAVSGVAGGAMILSNNHPYISLVILALGASANEIQTYIKTYSKD